MKTKTLLLIIAAGMMTCANVNAQSPCITHEGKLNIQGAWTASCPMEYMDKASIQHCDLCAFVVDEKDRSKAHTVDAELTFINDSIHIKRYSYTETVSYSMNDNTHAIQFTFADKEYKFRVFYAGEGIILQDDQGLLLVMEKKK